MLINLELKKRLFKYVIMVLMTVICLRYIPQNYIDLNETFMISLSTSTTFALLDLYTPSINYK